MSYFTIIADIRPLTTVATSTVEEEQVTTPVEDPVDDTPDVPVEDTPVEDEEPADENEGYENPSDYDADFDEGDEGIVILIDDESFKFEYENKMFRIFVDDDTDYDDIDSFNDANNKNCYVEFYIKDNRFYADEIVLEESGNRPNDEDED